MHINRSENFINHTDNITDNNRSNTPSNEQLQKTLVLLSFLYQVKLFQEFDYNQRALTNALKNWSKDAAIKYLGYDCAPVAVCQDNNAEIHTPEGSFRTISRRLELYVHGFAPHHSGTALLQKISEKNPLHVHGTCIALNTKDWNGQEHSLKQGSLGQYDEIKPYLYLLKYLIKDHSIISLDIHGDCLGGWRTLTMLAFLYQTAIGNEKILDEIGIDSKLANTILRSIKSIYLFCPLQSIENVIGGKILELAGDTALWMPRVGSACDLACRVIKKTPLLPPNVGYINHLITAAGLVPRIRNSMQTVASKYARVPIGEFAIKYLLPWISLFNMQEHMKHNWSKMLEGAVEQYPWNIFLCTVHPDFLVGTKPLDHQGTVSNEDRTFYESLPALPSRKKWIPCEGGTHMNIPSYIISSAYNSIRCNNGSSFHYNDAAQNVQLGAQVVEHYGYKEKR